MKRILIALIIAVALGAGGLVGVNTLLAGQADNATVQAAAQQEKRTFTVENMTCATCPITVRKAMQGVEGVQSVEVDFGAKAATAVFDAAITTPEAIAQASADAGYPANLKSKDK